MKVLKAFGILLLIAAACLALFVIARVETEDSRYKAGEMTRVEMMSDSALMSWIGVSIGLASVGGLLLAVRFLSMNRHLPLLDRRVKQTSHVTNERPLSTEIEVKVPLVDDDYIGVFNIYGYLYALHLTENGTYVITDTRDYNKQYWSGNISALKALEAYYDDI